MADQYARNKNPMLVNSKVLGASYKPQNLGFGFKITYITVEYTLIEV